MSGKQRRLISCFHNNASWYRFCACQLSVVLEIAMCAVIYLIMGDSVSIAVYVAILISTAVCDVLSYLVKWYLEKEEADKINRRIAERRRKNENE